MSSMKAFNSVTFISWKTHVLMLAGSRSYQIWLGRFPFAWNSCLLHCLVGFLCIRHLCQSDVELVHLSINFRRSSGESICNFVEHLLSLLLFWRMGIVPLKHFTWQHRPLFAPILSLLICERHALRFYIVKKMYFNYFVNQLLNSCCQLARE